MNSFLEKWLLAALPVLQRDLSGQAELRPAEQFPAPEKTVSFALSIGDSATGSFTVSAELAALHPILVEAGLVGPEPDVQRDYELWRGVIQDATVAAAEAFGGARAESIAEVQWSSAQPSATYELRLGNSAMPIALTDQVRANAKPEAGTRTAAPAGVEKVRLDRPGIDLLLDVELEASLRFGSCEMTLNEVLELGPGDVVELDRHVADPVDLLVGDKIVARGEVVLVNGAFGLRVLEVAEPRKCLESVRCLF